ncbi:MAG: LytTR family DNA-binding domain-containing protein [Breznakibacter sp.]
MDLSQKLPAYLTDKKNITRLIIWTAAFALVFINIYAPFGIKTFLNVKEEWELLLMSSGIILTGVLVVAISRIIMYHYVKRGGRLTILQYLAWIAVEILSMASFYTLYEMVFLKEQRPLDITFRNSMLNTSLVLLLPYSVMWLYFSWRDKDKLLKAIRGNDADSTTSKSMVLFKDEKGTLRISIKPPDLLYLQGSDNYVTLYYTKLDKSTKFLLRNSLKRIETELEGQNIIRCHRSFMVNINRVKLVKKDKDGLILELDTPESIEIPVSKTYMKDVLQAFGHAE